MELRGRAAPPMIYPRPSILGLEEAFALPKHDTTVHPSDAQLVAYARPYFRAEDRMLGQKD